MCEPTEDGIGSLKHVSSSSAEQAAKWLRRQTKPVGGAEESLMREERRNRNRTEVLLVETGLGHTAKGRGRGRRLKVAWPSGVRVARTHVRRGGVCGCIGGIQKENKKQDRGNQNHAK
eukprot:6181750-Pleurochrysis_carterae.AAC.1